MFIGFVCLYSGREDQHSIFENLASLLPSHFSQMVSVVTIQQVLYSEANGNGERNTMKNFTCCWELRTFIDASLISQLVNSHSTVSPKCQILK